MLKMPFNFAKTYRIKEEPEKQQPVRFEYEPDAKDNTKVVIDYAEVDAIYGDNGDTIIHLKDGRIVHLPEWL